MDLQDSIEFSNSRYSDTFKDIDSRDMVISEHSLDPPKEIQLANLNTTKSTFIVGNIKRGEYKYLRIQCINKGSARIGIGTVCIMAKP
jgi:hypothetical protein